MKTIKRYWSATPSLGMTNQQRQEWDAFDAKLTPDDVREMQIIDADCNDCRYFKRGAMVKVPGLTMFDGHCLKFDKETSAYPMQYTGHECFVHRKQAV